jgi:hypothetical protein
MRRRWGSAGGAGPRIERGFDIAAVPLNLEGKNRRLVGLGSYIVNAQADCNGCHSAGPRTEFAETHTLASRRRSIGRPTWVENEISAS